MLWRQATGVEHGDSRQLVQQRLVHKQFDRFKLLACSQQVLSVNVRQSGCTIHGDIYVVEKNSTGDRQATLFAELTHGLGICFRCLNLFADHGEGFFFPDKKIYDLSGLQKF